MSIRNALQKSVVTALIAGAIGFGTASADVTVGPMAEKGPEDVPALIEALKSDTMGTRWNAALLLGEIGDKSAVPSLIECAEGEANTRVRRRAFEALGKLGDTSAVPALIAGLGDDDSFVRRDAARALGELGNKSAVPALVGALKDDEGFVRRDIARALGKLGDPAAVPALQDLTREKGSDYSLELPLEKGELSPVAREAYFALGALGGDTAVSALMHLVQTGADPDLGGYGPRMEFYDPLKADVRARAARALGAVGPIALPALKEVLQHEDSDVRGAAVAALCEIGGAEGVAGLTLALNDEDMVLRRTVVQALGELGDAAALPALKEALNAAGDIENARWRGRIVQALNAAIAACREEE